MTANGRIVRADADGEPDLFWALRGGGGSFAVVTALEFALHPVAEVYAGALFWPLARAEEVLNAASSPVTRRLSRPTSARTSRLSRARTTTRRSSTRHSATPMPSSG